jgi:uncharacterized protein YqjF (DUF2071 family)
MGLVPFRMSGVMRRPLPDLPWVSAFPELNVRTYVTDGKKPGVWFFRLDARNALAVWAPRTFHLPDFRAGVRLTYERAQGEPWGYLTRACAIRPNAAGPDFGAGTRRFPSRT